MPVIIILMGVSGSGKTTVGKLLAKDLGWEFYEGDDFHPQQNILKMHRGIPLNDEDRIPWLVSLRLLIGRLLIQKNHAVIACSALKHAYRAWLTKGHDDIVFVYLHGSYTLIHRRLQSRTAHFMNPGLLISQFNALEEPQDGLCVNINQAPENIVRQIKEALQD
ncbi:MAG: gluconokinase [Nitrospirales bacterium]|nr:gluconokinase [Nitrospirales bacterium]